MTEKYVILVGSISKGFKHIGPFLSFDAAIIYGEKHFDEPTFIPYQVVTLSKPDPRKS